MQAPTPLLAATDRPSLDALELPEPAPRRRSSRAAKVAVVLADVAMVTAALVLAFAARASFGGHDVRITIGDHLTLGAIGVPLWIASLARRRLYTARILTRRLEELRRLVAGSVAGVLGLLAAGYALQLDVSRAWVAMSALIGMTLLAAEREVVRQIFLRLRRQGSMLRNVVIVGSNDEARELAAMLIDDPGLGYRVVGFVDDHDPLDRGDVLGPVHETLSVVRRTGASGVIIAASATSLETSNRLVRELVREGVHVELSSTLRDIAAERLTVRPLGRFPIVYLEPRRTYGWRSLAKRSFDVLGASLGLLAIAPIYVATAIAIKLDSRGPIIFRQIRVGKDGAPFEVRKFRTMVTDAEARMAELLASNEADGPLFKMRNDPRVTRVGRLLRKTSLDELPQLLNVLRGEMSLVGPRPALPQELLAWDADLHNRLRVKPGITGMWQVSGRSDSSFETYSRLDLYYVDNWSLVTDLAILAKTIPCVLFGRGAY